MAWLNATPKPDEGTKRAKIEGATPKLSRIEQLKKDKVPIPWPPNPAPHILGWWIDIGLTESNGMGAVPLSWGEINEWQCSSSVTLAPWEAKLIRKLSVEYIAEGRRAESENYPAPWKAEVTQREREVEQAGLQSLLG